MSLANSGTASGDPLSRRIVDAVATKEDVAPEELSPPLYDVVDPEALDRLFDSTARVQRGGPGRVAFRYLGYTIRVRADGDVEVVDPEQ